MKALSIFFAALFFQSSYAIFPAEAKVFAKVNNDSGYPYIEGIIRLNSVNLYEMKNIEISSIGLNSSNQDIDFKYLIIDSNNLKIPPSWSLNSSI
jgi:hypothetical protein